ncbi:MAG: hypothetical protein EZS28_030418 [Streblomastix strix]|uniref:Uncharacterized protein n=1 Tax=Streblomastix strix TaxID=222440 RepID=A0A5J4UW91_9EUKA|nr:MAG: hypothetical protein EZS28_030418 [Streblomastix strix]
MFVSVLACILFLFLAPADAMCELKQGLYSLDVALACMRSIPLTQTEKTTTISLMKTYLSSYAFIDTSLNPDGGTIGYGAHSVDIMGGLDSIGANTSYTNTFDFYEDIMVLLYKLKDPHTEFEPPCVQNFWYYFNYNFFVDINETDGSYYVTDNQGYQINKINLKGLPIYKSPGVDNEGTFTALEAISQFAQEEVHVSRNPVARFTYASRSDFTRRYALYYKHPEYDVMYYERENGQEVKNEAYVYIQRDIKNLEDECPIHPDHIKSSNEGRQNEIFINIKQNIKKIWLKIVNNNNKMMNKKKENEIQIKRLEHIKQHMIRREEQQMKITKQLEKQFHINEQDFNKIEKNDKLWKHNNQSKFTNADEDEDEDIIESQDIISADGTEYQVYDYMGTQNQVDVAAYRIPSRKVGIIYIATFYPYYVDGFAWYITQITKQFKQIGGDDYVERILIDVRGNGGGLITVGRQAINFLFPQVGFPLAQIVDQVKSLVHDQMSIYDEYIAQNYVGEVPVDVETLQEKGDFYNGKTIKRTTTSSVDPQKQMTVDLTDKYVLFAGYNDYYLEFAKNWDLKRKELFSPQDVIILTDGICASTCSQFAKHIGQKHLARV